ncbi:MULTISPECIES: hypothetical protein [unclassified Flavobacterium]|uniref:hypothetical protein n=1 Tax=unclassified Flavobacterium TaxID=196869 RepID=UPI000EB1312A|nr:MULTISPECIES: hypothetical protein [unclassified Flavobacterium]RKS02133.1 hypothetical protein C8C84_1836 [Flavobacterium sp. 102]
MKKITILVFLLISFIGYSQKSYSPGYYIDQSNNKKEGFIDNSNPYNNPEKIYFKTSLEEKTIEISIDNIKEFKINSNYKFVKYTVDYDYEQIQNSNKIKILGKEPKLEQKVVLLKLLVEGNVSLYKAIIGDVVFFYVKNKDDVNPKLLVHRKYNQDNSIKENNDYRKQLYDDLKSDKLVFNDFLDIDYDEKELVSIFSKANTENNSFVNQNISSEIGKNKLQYKIIAGTSLYRANYTFNDDYKLTPKNASFNNPMVGVEFSNSFGINSYRSELFVRLFYQKVKTEADYFSQVSNDYNVRYTMKSDFSSINVTAGYRYALYKKGKNKFYVDGSIGLSKVLEDDFSIDYLVTYTTPNPIPSPSDKYVFDQLSTVIFLNAGVGYVFNNRFGLGLEYSANKNYLKEYALINGSFSNINLIFTYTLNH